MALITPAVTAFCFVNRIYFVLPIKGLKGTNRWCLVYSFMGLLIQMSIHFYFQYMYLYHLATDKGKTLHTLIFLFEQTMLICHYLSFINHKTEIRFLLKRIKKLISARMKFSLVRTNYCFIAYCITSIALIYNTSYPTTSFGIFVNFVNYQIIIIVMQYTYCLDILCEIFRELIGDLNSTETVLVLQIELHQYFIRMCQKMNNFFSAILVITIPKLLFTIISASQETFQYFFSFNDFLLSILSLMYLSQYLFLAFILCDVCSRTKKQVSICDFYFRTDRKYCNRVNFSIYCFRRILTLQILLSQ